MLPDRVKVLIFRGLHETSPDSVISHRPERAQAQGHPQPAGGEAS